MAKLLIADSNTKISSMFLDTVAYMFSTNKASGFPLVGAVRVGDIVSTLFIEYDPEIDYHIQRMYANDNRLFFNYMRIVCDLVMGKDVTLIMTQEYDDLSVEIFLHFLNMRYGITAKYVVGNETEYDLRDADVIIRPDAKQLLSYDLERFRALLFEYEIKSYENYCYIYPADWR